MIEFTAQKEELKKAFAVVSLATVEKIDTVQSHALFDIRNGILHLYSTNKDKMAIAKSPVEDFKGESENIQFTSDPKKIMALLNSSGAKKIRFSYDPKTKTLNVYASETGNSYLSFASFDPQEFLSFESELSKMQEEKTLNAGIFLSGLRFIQGFLSQDDKNKKFSSMYISDSVMYGSNGSNKIGAFKSAEFEGINAMGFRGIMLSPISSMIDKIDISEITIKTTSKVTGVFSSDGTCGFAFRKASEEMPKFPIKLEEPKNSSFNTDRNIFLKKINRLAITCEGSLGIKTLISGNEITMTTLSERKSTESMSCKMSDESSKFDFIFEHRIMKNVLSLFHASNIDIYIGDARCIIRSKANLEIESERKPFVAVALLSLAREV